MPSGSRVATFYDLPGIPVAAGFRSLPVRENAGLRNVIGAQQNTNGIQQGGWSSHIASYLAQCSW